MTARGAPPVRMRLDRAGAAALWRHLGLGERPPLLDAPETAATLTARDAADRAALAALPAAGTVPGAALADALRALARPEVDADLRCWEGDADVPARWFGVVAGELAVVVAPDDTGWTLDVADRPGPDLVGALADRLLARLPAAAPLAGGTVTMSLAALAGGAVSRHVATRAEGLLAVPPRRRMQLGAGVHEHGGRRRVGPVTVVDTGAGRAVVATDGATVRLCPADRPTIRRCLTSPAG